MNENKYEGYKCPLSEYDVCLFTQCVGGVTIVIVYRFRKK